MNLLCSNEMWTLSLQSCDNVLDTTSISFTTINETFSGAIIVSRYNKQFYYGINTTKLFSQVQLFTKQALNASKESWQLKYVLTPVSLTSIFNIE